MSRYTWNPFTGRLDRVGGSGGGGSVPDGYIVEHRDLTMAEATNKELTLANTPPDGTKVSLDIVSGVPQQYGTDYTVTGDTLSWNGLGLDVTLEEGDKVRIIYPI